MRPTYIVALANRARKALFCYIEAQLKAWENTAINTKTKEKFKTFLYEIATRSNAKWESLASDQNIPSHEEFLVELNKVFLQEKDLPTSYVALFLSIFTCDSEEKAHILGNHPIFLIPIHKKGTDA